MKISEKWENGKSHPRGRRCLIVLGAFGADLWLALAEEAVGGAAMLLCCTKFIILNTKSIIFNAKFIIFTHRATRTDQSLRCPPRSVAAAEREGAALPPARQWSSRGRPTAVSPAACSRARPRSTPAARGWSSPAPPPGFGLLSPSFGAGAAGQLRACPRRCGTPLGIRARSSSQPSGRPPPVAQQEQRSAPPRPTRARGALTLGAASARKPAREAEGSRRCVVVQCAPAHGAPSRPHPRRSARSC